MTYGLYIHVPFCIKKCDYCDFASISASDELHKAYFSALYKEIECCKGAVLDSIFIGGGTPSCVDEQYIFHMFEYISRYMNVIPNSEITIEANPGTLTREKLAVYKLCGINRISIGAQSMQDNELHVLGRIHNSSEIAKAVSLIREAGFTNYNLDLMLATPHQTIESLADTLEKSDALSPSHISAYSLIVEPDTPFYDLQQQGSLPLPDEDTERKMYDFTVSYLQQNGYEQYEISNFAKKGFKCTHNLKYWQCMPYIGIGSAAHSYDGSRRYANTSNAEEYIRLINEQKNAITTEEMLSADDIVSEYIIMGLRLLCGISLDDFYNRFSFRFEEKYKKIINRYTNGGFMERKDGYIRLTHNGIAVSNTILCEFV